MITTGVFLALLVLIVIFIYTASYGVWTWKSKNKPGAVVIFLLAFVAMLLPLYKLFFRE